MLHNFTNRDSMFILSNLTFKSVYITIFMMYLHAKFQCLCQEFINIIKPKGKYKFQVAAMLSCYILPQKKAAYFPRSIGT